MYTPLWAFTILHFNSNRLFNWWLSVAVWFYHDTHHIQTAKLTFVNYRKRNVLLPCHKTNFINNNSSVQPTKTLDKTEGSIKNRQSKDNGNIGHTRHRNKTTKQAIQHRKIKRWASILCSCYVKYNNIDWLIDCYLTSSENYLFKTRTRLQTMNGGKSGVTVW